MLPRPPISTLFPYTTLFRSRVSPGGGLLDGAAIPRRVGERDRSHGRQRHAGLAVRLHVGARGARVPDAPERVREALRRLAAAIEGGHAVAEARRLHHRTIERLLQVALELGADGGPRR